MGIFQSCLARNNKVGVMGKEEVEEYEKVIRTMVTEDVTEKKGGLAFGLSFISEDEAPKPVPSRLVCGDKEENFEKWRGIQRNTCRFIFGFLFCLFDIEFVINKSFLLCLYRKSGKGAGRKAGTGATAKRGISCTEEN